MKEKRIDVRPGYESDFPITYAFSKLKKEIDNLFERFRNVFTDHEILVA